MDHLGSKYGFKKKKSEAEEELAKETELPVR